MSIRTTITMARAPAGGRGAQGRGRGRPRGPNRQRNPVLPNNINAPTQRHRYHRFLAEFMEYKNKVAYPSDKTFTDEELLEITPDHLYRWMCFKVFEKEDPTEEDTPLLRSSSVYYWKKAVSYFMPNTASWTIERGANSTGIGNPTKSKKVNDLIKAMKRKETRGTGQKTSADRSFDHAEFLEAVYAKVSETGRRVTEMQNFMIAEFAVMKNQGRRTEEIVRGMSYAPARRIIRRVNLQGPPPVGNRIDAGPPATLSRNPRTLECLWDEYCNGIGGAKPARDFNREERGRLKFKYSRRLIVWKCIERQLVGGCNLTTALMRIKSVYGDHSMSDTIKALRKDERNGGHARLR